MNTVQYIICQIFISVPSTIDVKDLNREPQVVVTRSITIYCPARGFPPATVTWLKDGQEIDIAAAKHLTTSDAGRQLDIVTARVSDTGRYTCRVENEAGESTLDFSLSVYGKLLIIFRKFHS